MSLRCYKPMPARSLKRGHVIVAGERIVEDTEMLASGLLRIEFKQGGPDFLVFPDAMYLRATKAPA